MVRTLLLKLLLSLALLSCGIGFFVSELVAAEDESIDALLNEANRALGGSSKGPKPSEADENGRQSAGATETSKKTKSKPRVNTKPKLQEEAVTSPSGANTGPTTPEDTTLKPLDAERVSQILALDLQAQERERVTRSRSLGVRLGLAQDRIPAVYEVEKDDDTFRMGEQAQLNGAALEATAVVPIHFLGREMGLEGAPFWGLTAGAGILQGDVHIIRRGVTNENRVYPYQVMTTDGGLSVGWASNLGKSTSAGYQIWLSAGYGADIMRQKGDGQYDTFSEVFHGNTFAIGSSWRSQTSYELYLQVRQRGRFNAESKGPTRTKLAGRMITLGFGVPISG